MTSNVENAFLCNVLMPDLLFFAVGMSTVFGLMLLIL